MDITNTFRPIAVELIQNVFATDIVYIRNLGSSYDPVTGEVVENTEEYSIKAGVLSRGRAEDGGVGEDYEIRLWIDHSATGMPHLPKTGDVVEYDSTQWRVTVCDPTYSSEGLIASKLTCKGN